MIPEQANISKEHKLSQKEKSAKDSGWVGTDESGKGDYFGPLVVAGVYLDNKTAPQLEVYKVRDSKKISDRVILDLDYKIRSSCIYSVVVIGPEKYNLLYSKMKNLNRILAWGHARVIENILLKKECSKVISDQFGDEKLIQQALMEKGKKIMLIQMPRAENDLAVASASIVARAEFLRRMEALSKECGITLPKGASPLVEETARKIVSQLGQEELGKFVKLHFKNTRNVLCVKK
ncbi:MAG: ribonuclease HIII [candidate division Zixibacteria bacterium]|nr:ribonuclease HIII [candidate division Zixibacteria bacterium]